MVLISYRLWSSVFASDDEVVRAYRSYNGYAEAFRNESEKHE